MNTENEPTRAVSAFVIEAEPREVDAGAEMTLTAEVACSPPRDLGDRTVEVRDGEGALVGAVPLATFDGTANRTEALVVKAPETPGEYTWSAALAATDGEAPAEEAGASFGFVVRPHATTVVVWDVPPTVVAGERFALKVGARCSSACRPAEWRVEIRDHEGSVLATTPLGDGPWPGTTALYFAEVELAAPAEPGLRRWTAGAPGDGPAIAHAPHALEFGVRAVPPPEVSVRVEVLDQQSRAPIPGAKVVVHPYRVFTDAAGVAELRVPKGEYTILVSGRKHIPYRTSGPVSVDTTLRAELALDVGLSDADIWS